MFLVMVRVFADDRIDDHPVAYKALLKYPGRQRACTHASRAGSRARNTSPAPRPTARSRRNRSAWSLARSRRTRTARPCRPSRAPRAEGPRAASGGHFQIAHAGLELQQLQLLAGQLFAARPILRNPLQAQLLFQYLNLQLRILQFVLDRIQLPLQLCDDLRVGVSVSVERWLS